MKFLDIILGVFLIWGLYKGFVNGLFVELSSLTALIAGVYGALNFSYIVGYYLAQCTSWDMHYIKLVSFIITFISIIILVHFMGKLLTKVADFAMLGFLNKIAGSVFGILKVAFILGVLLVFFEGASATFHFMSPQTKTQSVLYYPIHDLGAFVFDIVFDDRYYFIEF